LVCVFIVQDDGRVVEVGVVLLEIGRPFARIRFDVRPASKRHSVLYARLCTTSNAAPHGWRPEDRHLPREAHSAAFERQTRGLRTERWSQTEPIGDQLVGVEAHLVLVMSIFVIPTMYAWIAGVGDLLPVMEPELVDE
jgi:hypothetical protein